MTTYKCYKCKYEWEKRKDKPKACPRCKTRLDIVFKEKVDNPKEQEIHIVDEDKEAAADLKKDVPDTKLER